MAERRRGMGRGLAAILPESDAGGPELRELDVTQIEPNPDQPRATVRRLGSRRPGRVDRLGRAAPASDRSPPRRRPLRAGRRRAALAGRAAGWYRPSPGGRPHLAGGRAPPGGSDREHGPGGPQSGGGGEGLRGSGRRPRDLQGGARPPGRPQPGCHLQPDPAAGPPRPGARPARARRAQRGPRPGDPPGPATRTAAPGWPSRQRPRAGRSATPSAGRTTAALGGRRRAAVASPPRSARR